MRLTKLIKLGCEMYDLIVLGQVPGTDIEITFAMWMSVLAGLATIYYSYKLVRGRRMAMAFVRKPLHANQLHLRV